MEHADRSGPFAMDRFGRSGFENLFPLGADLDYEPAPEASVAARARREGRDVWELAYDLLLGFDGREFLLLPLLNYGGGSYEGLHRMMLDPFSVQGLGDAGAHVGLVSDASMTTYLLTHWARDRRRGPTLPLETVVRRLTHDPARLYGFADRGLVAPGQKADLNLIEQTRGAPHLGARREREDQRLEPRHRLDDLVAIEHRRGRLHGTIGSRPAPPWRTAARRCRRS